MTKFPPIPVQEAVLAFVADPTPRDMATNPLLEALEARLESYDVEQQELVMSFRPPDLFRQGGGLIQGGIQSGMLDFVMAFAGMAAVGAGSLVISVDLSTHFISLAGGDRFLAAAKVTKAGRRVVFLTAALTGGDAANRDTTIATATSSMLVLPH
ncbi:MAG: PaaI family thioesterase [Acidimicrobiales bacterium]